MLPITSVTPSPNFVAALPAVVLGLAGMAILSYARSGLRGTTLIAAWCWAVASMAMITAATAMLAIALPDGSTTLHQALYFAAAMTTFCPLMAMLGAKRPQNRAWQWIVLSLWVVLALPSGEWLLFHTGGEIHAARSWFLAILIGIGTLNYLPTRFWLASLLFAAGEIALLQDFLPGPRFSAQPQVALSLLVAALAVAAWFSGRRSDAAEPLDRAWLDFRNLFGAVWALRVAERINAAANQGQWNLRLHWPGFQPPGNEQPVSAQVRGPLTRHLHSLLRRFVSTAWIAERLGSTHPKERS